jgi:[calcium/calmodulin-dependent protein kinase] kinase
MIARIAQMGCGGCFGFSFAGKPKPKILITDFPRENHASREPLWNNEPEEDDDDEDGDCSYNGDMTGDTTDNGSGDEHELQTPTKRSEEIIMWRTQNGWICREFPVRETNKLIRIEDDSGIKRVNEYVRVGKIGAGSYGKVLLYQSSIDGKQYAIKSFHKSHLLKLRVAPSETAMSDVLREVLIMKMLEHPNIVNLIEVIDDPTSDYFYMVLEYVEGKLIFDASDPPVGLEENIARKYLRDIVSGLMYLHAHNIVHGDIKPDNLLISASGTVKIGDFSVSQVFEGDNDELRRSPGTPVFTAPECCLGLTYHGKTADTWAVGVTLYCIVFGTYPFLGDTLQDTYEKIVSNELSLPNRMNPLLKNLIEGLLCKDPSKRLTLEKVAEHKWVVEKDGALPKYSCWCKRNRLLKEESF